MNECDQKYEVLIFFLEQGIFQPMCHDTLVHHKKSPNVQQKFWKKISKI